MSALDKALSILDKFNCHRGEFDADVEPQILAAYTELEELRRVAEFVRPVAETADIVDSMRERDKLWCAAILAYCTMDQIEEITIWFNKNRSDR